MAAYVYNRVDFPKKWSVSDCQSQIRCHEHLAWEFRRLHQSASDGIDTVLKR